MNTERPSAQSGAYPKYDPDRRDDRLIDQLAGPSLRKCAATSPSAKQLSMGRAKSQFRELLTTLEIGNREAGRLLHVDESTIRGWLDERDFKRNPPQWAIDALGAKAHQIAAMLHLRAADRTGT